jgi:CheY-like chemotaxis protein
VWDARLMPVAFRLAELVISQGCTPSATWDNFYVKSAQETSSQRILMGYLPFQAILQFQNLLETELEPARRANLLKLLMQEQDKLGQYSHEDLASLDRLITRNEELLDEQRALVVRLSDKGESAKVAEEQFETLVETQALLEDRRKVVQRVILSQMPVRATHLDGLRILVVEDGWQLGESLKALLESMGATVDGPVATTADADRLVSERVPDVALVDLRLREGELAGDLIRRLNERGISVVVTSGYHEVLPDPTVEVVAFLEKPFSHAQLLEIMRSLVKSPADSTLAPSRPWLGDSC